MSYPCFFLEETDQTRLLLRRFASGTACPKGSYHDAMVFLKNVPTRRITEPDGSWHYDSHCEEKPGKDDPRWPLACDCGHLFAPEDTYQLFCDRLYRRLDTGEIMTLREAPAGALWYGAWLEDWEGIWKGPDGRILMCRTPSGDWNIDSRASNCTMPEDEHHRCWVRHGDPTDPLGLKTGQPLHVDKASLTCQAGAGSIQCGNYHGFLHGGHLT